MKSGCVAFLLAGSFAFAQSPAAAPPAAASVKQLMLDVIHPSSNDILLAIYRDGQKVGRDGQKVGKDEKEWAALRRSALTLAESANSLMLPGRALDQAEWIRDAKMLADAGNSAYKAAQAKDANALAAVASAIDASCTTCHKRYRPNVFPKDGGSR